MPNIEMQMIVAVAQNNVIGDSNRTSLLWDLPEDLSRFYKLTKGHVVIMGKKTFESLPKGKLPHRINVVLSHTPPATLEEQRRSMAEEGSVSDLYFVDLPMLWEILDSFIDKKIFVIGGSEIYRQLFPFCSVVHYTLVDLAPIGDVLFPFSPKDLDDASFAIDAENWKISASTFLRYKYITYHLK